MGQQASDTTKASMNIIRNCAEALIEAQTRDFQAQNSSTTE